MFKRETVFVLGAGASWHYGYPTGEQLVLDVADMAKSLESECDKHCSGRYVAPLPLHMQTPENLASVQTRKQYWRELGAQCSALTQRLDSVRPLVIDYFLGWNPSLQEIGKLLIAAVILKCEAQFDEKRANANRIPDSSRMTEGLSPEQLNRINIRAFKDNWYRFLVHKLASNCDKSSDLLANKVKFITFNYDYSLESSLRKSLSDIDIFEASDIEEFLSGDRITHVYGCIRSAEQKESSENSAAFLVSPQMISWLGGHENPNTSPWLKLLQECHFAAQGIRTIDPHDKVVEDTLRIVRQNLDACGVAYILGYGFDENNNSRIGLSALCNSNRPGRHVYFTNFGDANSVNRRVGQLVGHYRSFFNESISSGTSGNVFEKSTRNVYEALELDFGLI